jgi:hypothetical protein
MNKEIKVSNMLSEEILCELGIAPYFTIRYHPGREKNKYCLILTKRS